MNRRIAKAWRATPLPFEFHAALDEGEWVKALKYYQAHPFHCPPVDTYDLLKSIIHSTGITADHIKQRFSDKIRVSLSLQKRLPEEVDWEIYWNALNNGDSKTISMALTGARVTSAASQIGVAESCAVLLSSFGKSWRRELIDVVPFGTVTKSNLISISLQKSRTDIAINLLSHTKVSKSDLVGLWPCIADLPWEEGLRLIAMCPKSAVPYDIVIPHLLDSGCDIITLAEFLETANVLGDSDVIAPLLKKAMELEHWAFVDKCVEHLVDIGSISVTAHRTFKHLCSKLGIEEVCRQLAEKGIALHTMTIEILEESQLKTS